MPMRWARTRRGSSPIGRARRRPDAHGLLGRGSPRGGHRRRSAGTAHGRRAARGAALVEAHDGDLAVGCVRLEEGEGLEAQHAGDEGGGERLERDVVVAHVAVVEAARELDLVLGRGQGLLEVGEGGDRLQVRVVLRHGEQAAQALAQHVLGRSDLGRVARGARRHSGGPGVGDRLEGAALVAHVALHRVDQVGDQVVAALELDVDLRPGFLRPVAGADQAVVREGQPQPDDDDDRDNDPNPAQSALILAGNREFGRYAWARRCHRVFLSIFLCLCLRIFLRRFLITEPKNYSQPCLISRGGSGRESYRNRLHGRMYFTDAHEELRLHVKRFLEKECVPHLEEWEEKTFPDSIFKRFGELGFLGLRYPPEYGGQGGDYFTAVVLSEEMAKAGLGGLAMAVDVQAQVATPPVFKFGTEEQRRPWGVPAIAGAQIAAL